LSLWRKLRKLGAAQLGDGLVALPYDARTKEHLEWQAAAVVESGGEAIVWIASPSAHRDTQTLVNKMRAERELEYRDLLEEVHALTTDFVDGRTLARVRRTMRDINRRDYFRADGRDEARRAVDDLGAHKQEETT
jgi:hypothetical protein